MFVPCVDHAAVLSDVCPSVVSIPAGVLTDVCPSVVSILRQCCLMFVPQ